MPQSLSILLISTLLFAGAAQAQEVVTDCDRAASHPDDQQRVAPGVERQAMDLARVIATCEAAVKQYPDAARQCYQLGRVLFYAGQNARAVEQIRQAADGGYAQAQFVFGTLINNGRPDAPTDPCLTERYWKQSGANGRQAARVQYVRMALAGRFDGCAARADAAGLAAMLATAKQEATGFYERLLIDDLSARVAALPGGQR